MNMLWNPFRLEYQPDRIKCYVQQRESVDMVNLVYAGTVDERVYRKLSKRMKDRYDVLGSIPDTIKDFWIDSIEQKERTWVNSLGRKARRICSVCGMGT